MPKWSPTEHEELLTHIIQTHKIDWNLVSADWKEEKGKSAPTAGAITQHIAKWVKGSGGGKKQTPVKVNGTPRTPKNPGVATATHRTPTSGTKRKANSMSDDDESEPDINAGVGHRASLPRRSKSAQPSMAYEAAVFEDEGEDMVSQAADGEKEPGNDEEKPAKILKPAFDSDDDSDASDFAKAFA